MPYHPIKITIDGIPMFVDGDGVWGVDGPITARPTVIVSVDVIDTYSSTRVAAAMVQAADVARFAEGLFAAWRVDDLGIEYLLTEGGNCDQLRDLIHTMLPWRGLKLGKWSVDDTLDRAQAALAEYENAP